MKTHLIYILIFLSSFYSSAQQSKVVLTKLSIDHQPWHGNTSGGENDAKIVLVSTRHELLLQQFTDSSLIYLSNAMHQAVYRHDEKLQDVFLKAFTSNKKIIQRSHADYGFVVNVTLSMNSHSDVFGTIYLEPYVMVRIEMKDAAGTSLWKGEGYAEGNSAPAKNFNASNGKVYTEEVCGYDHAVKLFSDAMDKSLQKFDRSLAIVK